MTVKEKLHRLIDDLPERELATAAHVLEALHATGDPVARALDRAPTDELPGEADDLDGELTAARAESSVSHTEARRILLGEV
jgi:aminoglycoside phosphotransferase (APT) family kinase protein